MIEEIKKELAELEKKSTQLAEESRHIAFASEQNKQAKIAVAGQIGLCKRLIKAKKTEAVEPEKLNGVEQLPNKTDEKVEKELN